MNIQKCKYKISQVEFMGYPLSTRGIDPMADGSPIELGAILAQEHAGIFRQVIVQVEV